MTQLRGDQTAYRCLQTGALILGYFLVICLSRLGSPSFIQFAFVGAFLMELCLGLSVWRSMAIAAVAALYGLGYGAQHGPFVASLVGAVGAFLGVGSLIVNSTLWIWSSDRKAEHLKRFGEIALLPLLCVSSSLVVSGISAFLPKTYDLFLYSFDSALGIEPSFAMGRWFKNHVAVAYVSAWVYNCLPVYLAGFRAYQLRFDREGTLDVRSLFAALGACGFFLYFICPASGPANLLTTFSHTFPYNPPPLSDFSMGSIAVVDIPRNAMPSLHLGWTSIMCLYAWTRRRGILAISSTVFVIFTALATLGSGEHWLVDLIVTIPLVVAVFGACSTPRTPFNPAALTGLGITLGWLVALRCGFLVGVGPVTSWTLVAFTLLASSALLAMVVRRSAMAGVRSVEEPAAKWCLGSANSSA